MTFILITGSGICPVSQNSEFDPNNDGTSIIFESNISPDKTVTNQQKNSDNTVLTDSLDSQAIHTSTERDHYTSYDELVKILDDFERDHSSILKLYDDLGTTHEERTIWMVKISDNPNDDEDDETEVLFAGAHHGDEAIGNELAIYIIETLTDGYKSDPRIKWLVDNHEIWVVPTVNPDGLEYTLNVESSRKNRSPNYISEVTPGPFDPKVIVTSYGTDLNRNYDYEWGDPSGSTVLLQRSGTYAGSEPFSELETQAIRDLVLAHNFSVYMDYHSGIELILYPWGYTADHTEDNPIFERVAAELSALSGFEARQGYDLYQTNGDSVDWIYSVSRALAFTVELSSPKMPDPSTLQPIFDKQIKLPLYLTGISGDVDTGSQIEIRHENIENHTDRGSYKITATVTGFHDYSDLDVQLYYKVNNHDYEIITMTQASVHENEYTGVIPTQSYDSIIRYFIVATDGEIMLSSPDFNNIFEFSINPSPESIPTIDELIGMVIMMILIMGFFWGGFVYTARLALKAERRKHHDYYFEEERIPIDQIRSGTDY